MSSAPQLPLALVFALEHMAHGFGIGQRTGVAVDPEAFVGKALQRGRRHVERLFQGPWQAGAVARRVPSRAPPRPALRTPTK